MSPSVIGICHGLTEEVLLDNLFPVYATHLLRESLVISDNEPSIDPRIIYPDDKTKIQTIEFEKNFLKK